jgi:hypothetical protein
MPPSKPSSPPPTPSLLRAWVAAARAGDAAAREKVVAAIREAAARVLAQGVPGARLTQEAVAVELGLSRRYLQYLLAAPTSADPVRGVGLGPELALEWSREGGAVARKKSMPVR